MFCVFVCVCFGLCVSVFSFCACDKWNIPDFHTVLHKNHANWHIYWPTDCISTYMYLFILSFCLCVCLLVRVSVWTSVLRGLEVLEFTACQAVMVLQGGVGAMKHLQSDVPGSLLRPARLKTRTRRRRRRVA